MPAVTMTHPHLLSKLVDELVTAFPAIAPTLRAEDAAGQRRVKATTPLPPGATPDPNDPAYMLLPAENPNTIHLSWPDDAGITEAQVTAVVNAHDPTPVPTQRDLDTKDLRDTYQAAVTRLDDIVANGGSYTAADVRTAVIDMARIQRRLLKSLRYLAT